MRLTVDPLAELIGKAVTTLTSPEIEVDGRPGPVVAAATVREDVVGSVSISKLTEIPC